MLPAVAALPALVAFVLQLAAAPLAAPSPDEQRLYADGQRAYDAGDARAAEQAWKVGYAVARDPAFLVHIAEAQEKAGAPAQAAETYRRYLREAPDASDRADIEQRLARLPAPPAPAAAAAPETPGELGAGAAPAPDLRAPAPASPAAAAPAAADGEGPPAAALEDDTGWNSLRIGAWVSTGVAVAALGTAGFFAASASSHEGDVNRLLIYRADVTGAPLEYAGVKARYEGAIADGERDARNAKIALGVAGAAAAVAATFFVLDARRVPEGRLALAPTTGPGGRGTGAIGSLAWRF